MSSSPPPPPLSPLSPPPSNTLTDTANNAPVPMTTAPLASSAVVAAKRSHEESVATDDDAGSNTATTTSAQQADDDTRDAKRTRTEGADEANADAATATASPPGSPGSPGSPAARLKRTRKQEAEFGKQKRMQPRDEPRPKGPDGEDDGEGAEGVFDENGVRIPKRKVAMLVSFVGTRYRGMQYNGDVPTIEGELLKAFAKSGTVAACNADIHKINFQRCARTDTGVSAIGQVISFKMLMVPNPIERINEQLPHDIRAHGYARVAGSFNARTACTSRVYSYTLPTFAFAPYKSMTWDYRIDAATLQKVRDTFAKYTGSHRFHNYTIKVRINDAQAMRVMQSCTVNDPLLTPIDREWLAANPEPVSADQPAPEGCPDHLTHLEMVTMVIEGQSFMYNQIRKMVGMVIAIVRGQSETFSIPNSFTLPQMAVPRAPGLGLALERVKFRDYERKFGKSDGHGSVHFDSANAALAQFKFDLVDREVVLKEAREGVMYHWLEELSRVRVGVDNRPESEVPAYVAAPSSTENGRSGRPGLGITESASDNEQETAE